MYNSMTRLKKVEVNKFTGPDTFSGIASTLPALNLLN